MSDELWSLLRETHEVQELVDQLRVSDAAGTTTPEQERVCRLRRAALAQRHLAWTRNTGTAEDIQDAETDAVMTAARLWEHDQVHGSHRGPIPATDVVWRVTGVQEYVRQEAAAAGLTGP